jgi:hypothetical protein
VSGELVSTCHGSLTRTEHAERIASAWRDSVQSNIETGRRLIQAKADLKHGVFMLMVEDDLPFEPRTGRMLMAVAGSPRITNRNHGSVLPASWRTLYELTKLSDDVFQARIADGTIHPEMQRKDVASESRQKKVEDEERILDLTARHGDKFATIVIDPPWDHEWLSLAGRAKPGYATIGPFLTSGYVCGKSLLSGNR